MMMYNDLFLVIVLYKKNLSNSETLRTLGKFLNSPINLLVFDNSPDRQYFSDYFVFDKFRVKYFHDGSNPGISAAYNFAIKEAAFENKRWVLLLDQDTVFTKDYFSEILTLDSLKLDADTVAIIPKVFSLFDNIISPAKMYLGGVCRPIIIDSGLSNDPITAINSGTIISVAFIKKIGGFSELFPLDMLDHWYFREIYKLKKKVLVLNSIIFQNLSVAGNYQKEVSVVRYRNMLIAEKLFVKQDGAIAYTIFILRLIRRAFKQIRFKNKKYFFESVKSLFSLN